MDKPHSGMLGKVQAIMRPLWLVIAVGIFLAGMHPHYPIDQWLFWRYAGYWLACAVFAFGVLGLGHAIVRKITGPRLPLLQHLAVAVPVGILGFEILMFFAGHLQLYHTWFFFAFPLALAAATAPRLVRDGRRWAAHLRAHAARAPRLSGWQWAVPVFGLLALSLVYFAILTPENVQFDVRWRHMAIAEDWVAHGGIRRFDEGWTGATGSHFHSFLYTWAFLIPGRLFDRIELAQHIEYVIFLFTTLITIPAIVRWLVPAADPRLVWASRFLYPGLFVYDSSLSGNADHIAAAYCAALLLVTVRALRDLGPRYLLIVSMLLAALLMGKETATLMMAPMAILLVAGRTVQFAVQAARRRLAPARAGNWWRGPLTAVVGCLVFSAPHWLGNLVWYGDPFYPILHKHFWPNPWTPDASVQYEAYLEVQMWAPPRSLEGVLSTLKALVNFSFVPNDWKGHHGKVPVFGSLMTLLLPCLLLVRGTRRIWFLVAWVHAGMFVWYWVHHQDRYLQSMLPWMAGITMALMLLLWRQGRLVTRGVLVVLVGAQVVWGLDTPFFQTHSMTKSALKTAADLLAKGHKRDYEKRFKTQGINGEMGEFLPDGARPMMHENHAHLGIRVSSVSDWTTWQFGISYGLLASPRDVYDMLKRHGVTHVNWVTKRSRAWDSVAADLMFFDFALRRTVKPKKFGKTTLAEMPKKPPPGPDEFDDSVAVLGCRRGYKNGRYRVSDLQTKDMGPEEVTDVFAEPREPAPAKPTPEEVDALIKDVAFVVLDPSCNKAVRPKIVAAFDHAATRKRVPKHRNVTYELFLRKLPKAAEAAKPGKPARKPGDANDAATADPATAQPTTADPTGAAAALPGAAPASTPTSTTSGAATPPEARPIDAAKTDAKRDTKRPAARAVTPQ